MENTIFDVVIAGRGPVGLFLAHELRLRGLSVLVLERRNETGTFGVDKVGETRACVVHGRTIEILEDRHLLSEFLEKGMRLDWWHYGVLDTRLQFSAFGDETNQNAVLFAPQYRTEEIFQKHAQAAGVEIRFGCRVEGVKQTNELVTISGSVLSESKEEGSPFTVKAKYLVGADGWKSAVRPLAGFGWENFPGTQAMMSVEAQTDENIPPAIIMKNDAGIIVSCKLDVPSQRARIVVWTHSRGQKTSPPTLEEFNEALTEVAGKDYKLYNPIALTLFTNESGYAKEYRQGRVLLAGDAAHKHLPAGGQGMNTGIQESYNLAWKLAAVIRGEAPESLLDTYETERLPIAKSVVENTTAQSQLFFAHSRPEMAARAAFDSLLKVPEANKALAQVISGLGYTYTKPLDMVRPAGWEDLPTGIMGSRASNVKFVVANEDSKEKHLKDFMSAGKWIQLRRLPKNGKESTPAVPALGDWTRVVDVVDILDGPGSDTSKYHAAGFSEILIRPDGHFAFGKN